MLLLVLLLPAAEPNPGHLRMGLVNLRCLTSASADPAANKAAVAKNLERHLHFIDDLAGKGVEFIGFPELSLNGYAFSKTMRWLSLDGPEVKRLAKKAAEKKVYVAAGLAEQDADGKKWNTHVVLGPDGKIVGKHHKTWLTAEVGFTEAGTTFDVFEVKGTKMGMLICADGTKKANVDALADKGAKLLYAPHANTTGGTVAGWYRFRAAWGGPDGWIAKRKLTAALHNHAAIEEPALKAPAGKGSAGGGWASGAWFIGPDGKTLAQMPTSTSKADSKEYVLIYNVALGEGK
jgi:predicted amidohydrolase